MEEVDVGDEWPSHLPVAGSRSYRGRRVFGRISSAAHVVLRRTGVGLALGWEIVTVGQGHRNPPLASAIHPLAHGKRQRN